jgi:hypothetical protein
VGQPGNSNTNGQILCTVLVYASSAVLDDFITSVPNMIDSVLLPFYQSTSINELMVNLPDTMLNSELKLIASIWPFFTLAHSYVVPNLLYGFPVCSVMETTVQALYNS